MSSQDAKHRHLLLAPLFVCAIIISALVGGRTSLATDAREGILELNEGSVLLGGGGISELRVGDMRLVSQDGAFHVSRNGEELIVAALSAPVIILDDISAVVVPPGSQWRNASSGHFPLLTDGAASWLSARRISPLPAHFVERELLRFSREVPFTPDLPGIRNSLPASYISALELPRFGAADDRRRAMWEEDVLGALRGIIERGDHSSLDALFSDPTYFDVLASRRSQEIIMQLLSGLPDTSPLRVTLLSKLSESPELRALVFMHPRYRSLSSLLQPESTDDEFEAARIAALLQWSEEQGPLQTFVTPHLRSDIRKFLDGSESPKDFLAAILPLALQSCERAEASELPETARVIASAMVSAAEGYESILSKKAGSVLEYLSRFGRINPLALDLSVLMPEAEGNGAGERSHVPDRTPDPREVEVLEREARLLLSSVGGLFTVETEVHAVSLGNVEVRSMIFSGAEGDHEASFTLVVRERHLRDIVVDERGYPLESSLEGFVSWMKK